MEPSFQNIVIVFVRYIFDMIGICGLGLFLMGIPLSTKRLFKMAVILAVILLPIRFLPLMMGIQVTLVFVIVIVYLNHQKDLRTLDAVGAGLLGSGVTILAESLFNIAYRFGILSPVDSYIDKLIHTFPIGILLTSLAIFLHWLLRRKSLPLFRLTDVVYDIRNNNYYYMNVIPLAQLFLGLLIIAIFSSTALYSYLSIWTMRLAPILLFALIITGAYIMGRNPNDGKHRAYMEFFDLIVFFPIIHFILVKSITENALVFSALYLLLIIANALKSNKIFGVIALLLSSISVLSLRLPTMIQSGQPWRIEIEIIFVLLFIFVYWLIRKFFDTERDWQRLLANQACKDSLTGLYNQRYLYDYLETRAHNCLLMMDVDNFKSINDTYGHLAGDKYLKLLAGELRSTFAPEYPIFRYGGDEFILAFNDLSDSKKAYDVGKQAQLAVKQAYDKFLAELSHETSSLQPVTCSVGIICTEKPVENYADMVNAADRALYTSKKKGKNRISMLTQ